MGEHVVCAGSRRLWHVFVWHTLRNAGESESWLCRAASALLILPRRSMMGCIATQRTAHAICCTHTRVGGFSLNNFSYLAQYTTDSKVHNTYRGGFLLHPSLPSSSLSPSLLPSPSLFSPSLSLPLPLPPLFAPPRSASASTRPTAVVAPTSGTVSS